VPALKALFDVNADTMTFVNVLRQEPTLAEKVCLNVLSHPVGAVHLKLAITGCSDRAVGFTGGLDLVANRHLERWHDVQAQVRGPVVQQFYEAYRAMWNEIRGRRPVRLSIAGVSAESHTQSMPHLPSRAIAGVTCGQQHVQSLCTLPRFHFTPGMGTLGLPTNASLQYAPAGAFEIRDAWKTAVGGAHAYVYIEDQVFLSSEVFDWVNAALRNRPGLRVILVTRSLDPGDRPGNVWAKALSIAVNEHLLRDLSPAEIDRIGVFERAMNMVHAKSVIVDDAWAMIGSANATRRSLYTDFEHAIAYMDEEAREVPAFRRDLWREHLGVDLAELSPALNAWFAVPFKEGGVGRTPGWIERLRLPVPAMTFTADEQVLYDEILDPDSSQAWGGRLLSQFVRSSLKRTLRA
jgi:phosphatidylserine/phosphatidylglycerophosphate/cardiolipin synthase-like enzyme